MQSTTKQIFFWWDTFRLSRFMDNLKGYDMNGTKSKVMPYWWTHNVHLDAGGYVLDVNVRPNTCFDDRFMAWCNDEKEILIIDGWNVAVIELEESA
jgi:hypothetical protein